MDYEIIPGGMKSLRLRPNRGQPLLPPFGNVATAKLRKFMPRNMLGGVARAGEAKASRSATPSLFS
eukprot:6458680-Amphidinium_carterae.1